MVDYEKETIDSDDMFMVDGEINPNKYIDITIQRALRCLSKDDPEVGFFQYVVLINALEGQCNSINKLSKDYFAEIDEFKKSKEYSDADTKQNRKQILLAVKKFELIMKELNMAKKVESPLIIHQNN